MNVDVMNEVDIITQDQIEEQTKQEQEDKLIPEGHWEGQVFSWNKVEESEKGEMSPYKGVSLYSVGIMFYDCPEIGKKKSGWFKMTPNKLTNPETGRPKVAYTSLVGLTKVLNCGGKTVAETLEQAKVSRAKFKVRMFETPEGNKVNFLGGVSAV